MILLPKLRSMLPNLDSAMIPSLPPCPLKQYTTREMCQCNKLEHNSVPKLNVWCVPIFGLSVRVRKVRAESYHCCNTVLSGMHSVV